jgi:hypothetical protein
MRLAKNRTVIEATGDVANLTLNSAERMLAPPRDDAEKLDDVVQDLLGRCERAIGLAKQMISIIDDNREILRGHITQEMLDVVQSVADGWTRLYEIANPPKPQAVALSSYLRAPQLAAHASKRTHVYANLPGKSGIPVARYFCRVLRGNLTTLLGCGFTMLRSRAPQRCNASRFSSM